MYSTQTHFQSFLIAALSLFATSIEMMYCGPYFEPIAQSTHRLICAVPVVAPTRPRLAFVTRGTLSTRFGQWTIHSSSLISLRFFVSSSSSFIFSLLLCVIVRVICLMLVNCDGNHLDSRNRLT